MKYEKLKTVCFDSELLVVASSDATLSGLRSIGEILTKIKTRY